jgi:prepilin-type N-terminal cleavage/methylation domain-containing protein
MTAQQRCRGFTLIETMIAATIFTMVIGGALATHLMGLKLFSLTKAKLGSSDEIRIGLSHLIDEVRSGKDILIGEGSETNFTAVADGIQQKGNAIQIFPTTNLTSFTRYYLNTNTKQLFRLTSTNLTPKVVINAISNVSIFTSEDYNKNILTNGQNNRVVGLTMQIYQLLYPAVPIGSNSMFDKYFINCRVTRRTLE